MVIIWWFDLYHLSLVVDLVKTTAVTPCVYFSSQLELSSNSLTVLVSWTKKHFVLNTWQAKQEHIQDDLYKTQKIKSNFDLYIKIYPPSTNLGH